MKNKQEPKICKHNRNEIFCRSCKKICNEKDISNKPKICKHNRNEFFADFVKMRKKNYFFRRN